MPSEDIRIISWWWVDKSDSERVILWLRFYRSSASRRCSTTPQSVPLPHRASLRHVRASLHNTTASQASTRVSIEYRLPTCLARCRARCKHLRGILANAEAANRPRRLLNGRGEGRVKEGRDLRSPLVGLTWRLHRLQFRTRTRFGGK